MFGAVLLYCKNGGPAPYHCCAVLTESHTHTAALTYSRISGEYSTSVQLAVLYLEGRKPFVGEPLSDAKSHFWGQFSKKGFMQRVQVLVWLLLFTVSFTKSNGHNNFTS